MKKLPYAFNFKAKNDIILSVLSHTHSYFFFRITMCFFPLFDPHISSLRHMQTFWSNPETLLHVSQNLTYWQVFLPIFLPIFLPKTSVFTNLTSSGSVILHYIKQKAYGEHAEYNNTLKFGRHKEKRIPFSWQIIHDKTAFTILHMTLNNTIIKHIR